MQQNSSKREVLSYTRLCQQTKIPNKYSNTIPRKTRKRKTNKTQI